MIVTATHNAAQTPVSDSKAHARHPANARRAPLSGRKRWRWEPLLATADQGEPHAAPEPNLEAGSDIHPDAPAQDEGEATHDYAVVLDSSDYDDDEDVVISSLRTKPAPPDAGSSSVGAPTAIVAAPVAPPVAPRSQPMYPTPEYFLFKLVERMERKGLDTAEARHIRVRVDRRGADRRGQADAYYTLPCGTFYRSVRKVIEHYMKSQ